MSLIPFAPLYLGTSRRTRPLPRGVARHVVDSRSPDPLGRIPTDQCSPSGGFPARRIHPIRSIVSRLRPQRSTATSQLYRPCRSSHSLHCISAAPAALDRYLAALPAMSLIPFAPLYPGCARSARPLPRGFTGHVAHPIRSIQISEPFPSESVLIPKTLHPIFGSPLCDVFGEKTGRLYFLEYLGGRSRTNDQETSAVSPVSYSTLKCERNFFGTLTRTGTAPGEILFAFLMALCGSRNERPSSNSTSNASSQSRYRACLTGEVLRLPKWFFDSADGFHSRPSLFSSSMTLINFLLGIQPSIPRIFSISSRPRNRSFAS